MEPWGVPSLNQKRTGKEAARNGISLFPGPGPGHRARCEMEGLRKSIGCQQGPYTMEMKAPSGTTTQGLSSRPRMPLTHTSTHKAEWKLQPQLKQ